VSDPPRQAPVVSGHQVVGAGFAAATAAFVTSGFGVAGTLLGAALTAMIITGGSAILKAYFESVTGNARMVPRKLRERRNRWKAGRSAEPPTTLPGRPDLRDNFLGRVRAALGWFSHLPTLTRRSILVKGLIGTAVAFVIGMGTIYAVEKSIGNSLSCGLWAECPTGATPGIHFAGGDGTGAAPTINVRRAKTNTATQLNGTQIPLQSQNSGVQNHAPPMQQGVPQASPDSGSNQTPRILKSREQVQSQTPQEEPVTPGNEPVAPQKEPVKPGSERQQTPQESPYKGGAEVPIQQGVPSSVDQQSAPSK
jgi:hypothetical protein